MDTHIIMQFKRDIYILRYLRAFYAITLQCERVLVLISHCIKDITGPYHHNGYTLFPIIVVFLPSLDRKRCSRGLSGTRLFHPTEKPHYYLLIFRFKISTFSTEYDESYKLNRVINVRIRLYDHNQDFVYGPKFNIELTNEFFQSQVLVYLDIHWQSCCTIVLLSFSEI